MIEAEPSGTYPVLVNNTALNTIPPTLQAPKKPLDAFFASFEEANPELAYANLRLSCDRYEEENTNYAH